MSSDLKKMKLRLDRLKAKDKKRQAIKRALKAGRISESEAKELRKEYLGEGAVTAQNADVMIITGHGDEMPVIGGGQGEEHMFSVGKGEIDLETVKRRLAKSSRLTLITFMYWQGAFRERAEHYAHEVQKLYPHTQIQVINTSL